MVAGDIDRRPDRVERRKISLRDEAQNAVCFCLGMFGAARLAETKVLAVRASSNRRCMGIRFRLKVCCCKERRTLRRIADDYQHAANYKAS